MVFSLGFKKQLQLVASIWMSSQWYS